MTTRFEQVTEPIARHGEGPVWDDERGLLLMVDIPAGDVLTLDLTLMAVVDRQHVGTSVGAVRSRRSGGLVAGVATGFAMVDPDRTVRALDPLWPGSDVRMNDGSCDPSGAFWCGSMALDESPGRGELWRLDPGGSPTRVMTGVSISNGLEFDDDGAGAFYVDSPTGRIDRLTLDDGAVVGREPWARVEVGGGVPDGICRDTEGGLWVCVHSGGAVVRLDAQGRVDVVVEVPTPRPTACAFGGPDLDVLYVTTSAVGVDDGRSGALFAMVPGVRGLPAHRFAG